MALPRLFLLGLWAAALRDGAVAAGEALTARRGLGADAATGGQGSACPRGRVAGSGSRAWRRGRKASGAGGGIAPALASLGSPQRKAGREAFPGGFCWCFF